MEHRNTIVSMGKDIRILFICVLIFMFFIGGLTQQALAAEDEITITLDANGGEAVDPQTYNTTQTTKVGILPETTRSGYVFNGWWTKNGGTSSSDSDWGSIVKFNSTSVPTTDTTYYARWTEDKDENNKQSDQFYGRTDKNTAVSDGNYGYIEDSSGKRVNSNYGHIEKSAGGWFNYSYIDCLVLNESVENNFLYYNFGKVTDNESEIDTNYGTVENNKAGAKVKINYRTIKNNEIGAVVNTNYGIIGKNAGTIKEYSSNTELSENSGTIEKMTAGSVRTNTGTIKDVDNKAITIYNYPGGIVGQRAPWGVEECTIWNMGGTVQGFTYSIGVTVYNFEGGTVSRLQRGSVIYNLGGTVTDSMAAKEIKCHKVNINSSYVDKWNDEFIINPDNGEVWLPEGKTGTFTVKSGAPQLYASGATLTKTSETEYTLSDAKSAIFIDDVAPSTITYDLNGGTVDGNPTTYKTQDRITLKNPTKKYYDFVGWTGTDIEEPSKTVTIEAGSKGNRHYTAVWKQAAGTAILTFDGQNDTEDQLMIYNIPAGSDTIGELPKVTKEGYNFVGWFTSKEGGTELTAESEKPHENTTYYAHWAIGTYTYVLDPNGGTPGSTTKITKVYKENIGNLPVVSKEGYIFNGWWSRNDEGDWESALTPNSAMKGQDITYYARWTKKADSYSDQPVVSPNFEGFLKENTGTIENNFGLIEKNAATIKTNYGVVDSVLDTASIQYNNNIVKDNQGIIDSNNGKIEKNTGVVNENNGVVYNYPDGSVKKNLGIVYNYGGTVSKDNTGSVIESYTVRVGKGIEKATLDNKSFVDINSTKWLEKEKGSATITVVWANGYNANGYHLEADGCKVTKNANGTYTLSKITKNTTIFAVPTRFSITYKLNNGRLSATNPATYTYETKNITLAAPSRQGYTFLGWTGTGLVGTTKNVTIKKGSFGNRTYTAVWKKDQLELILPKALVKGKGVQKVSWNRIDRADGYFVYSSVAGKKMKKVLDTRTVTHTFKKRKSATVYQYQIHAYKLVKGKKKVFCKSMIVYSVANNQSGKLTNVKNIKLTKKSYTLKVKKTATIKAKYTVYKKNKKLYSRVKTFRYISSNTKIAQVTAKGKIKAVKAGTCTVYVLAPNGVRKAIKVTVK